MYVEKIDTKLLHRNGTKLVTKLAPIGIARG